MKERLAYLDREEAYWSWYLALSRRDVVCCQRKLADLAEQRERLTGKRAEPEHEEVGSGRRWPVPCPDSPGD